MAEKPQNVLLSKIQGIKNLKEMLKYRKTEKRNEWKLVMKL